MRTALKSKVQRGRQVSHVKSWPAPIGGWNARDALAAMKPTDAVRLVNWFPRTTDCMMRGGRTIQTSGFDSAVETLAVYNALDGTSKMFAAAGSSIFDVSSFGVAGVNYLEIPGDASSFASTPDSAALDITGDIDLRAHMLLDDWTPTSSSIILTKAVLGVGGTPGSYTLFATVSGALQFQSYDGANTVSSTSTAAVPVTDGGSIWVRATLDANNGAGGNTVTFYTSTNGVAWDQLGDPVVNVGTVTMAVTTEPLYIGRHPEFSNSFIGKVYQALVYNGIAGSLVASMVADDTTPGDTSFPSLQTGETWTVAGTAAIATNTDSGGFNSARWQWINMGNGTNNYLLMFNGVDEPQYYDGSTWISVDSGSSPALSGIASTELIYPMVYQGRLFIIQKNSLSTWFLAAGAVGGALTEFDFSSIFKMGGYLVAQGAWTVDGGDGVDDYAAFVTSEGEVAIYRGTNPASAATWLKVGTYFLGRPLGRRCLTSYGGDLILVTQNGAFPLSQALQSATIDYRTAVTNKIETAFNDAARDYGTHFGWEATLFPSQSALVFNVPIIEGAQSEQYVMNTITKSWCRFNSWNANTFVVFNSELYFGGDGEVWKAWTGAADDQGDIIADAKTAFSYFGAMTQSKQFKLYRPMLAVNGNISFLSGIDVNFNDNPITGTATFSVASGAQWDVSSWDEAFWAAGLQIAQQWTSPQENVGYCAAAKIKISTNSLTVQWMANDIVYEEGGVL